MKTIIKFTGPGRKPIYGVDDYPPIGEWSESRTPELCLSGWHVSCDDHLAGVLGAEMWIGDVDGKEVSDGHKSAHELIRFVRKVDAWNRAAMVKFAQGCAERAQDYAATTAACADASAAAYAASAAAYAARAAASAASYAAANAAHPAAHAATTAASAAAYTTRTAAAAYAERRIQSNQLRQIAGLA